MIIENKANGRKIKISKESFDKMTSDQKLRYNIIDRTDETSPSSQSVVNEAKKSDKDKKK